MKIREILNKHLKEIKLSKEEFNNLKKKGEKLVSELKENIKKNKIKAEVFIGGSLAKKTIMKKSRYDIDVFVRFDKKYSEKEISQLLGKIMKNFKAKKIHGSRDYYQLTKKFNGKDMVFEIIPILKISYPKEMRNVTDLSYFHVSYVKNKINKNHRLADEILMAKSFCFSQNVYGAESYISGFSGYALELLIIHYRSFLNFLRKIKNKKKIILDPENYYKGKRIRQEINESKLKSPVVFIDPTYKKRNATAALSYESFEKFQKQAEKFLKNPSESFFQKKEISPENYNLILEVETKKQEGDIAGSKLKKFFNVVSKEIEKYFSIKEKEFEYLGNKTGRYYFLLEKKKERILSGPPLSKKQDVKKFKKKHKNVFKKNNKFYAREKMAIDEKKFIQNFKKQNKKVMREMGISGLKII